MKLSGKAKAAFLAKMAAGRGRARGQARKGRRRRRNPDLLTIAANPRRAAKRELALAAAAYRRFHGVAPKTARRIGRGSRILIALGELREVIYQPRRGARRGPAFFHRFGRGAQLATTVDGKRLVLVPSKGKPFRVDFDRGILG